MPSPTPNQKINQVKMFGENFIEIVIEGDTFDDAFSAAKEECDSKNKSGDPKACCPQPAKESTSGCTPSNCRGEKTKFGEAKVISNLRKDLIALKAKMENYKTHTFSNKAITVHGIVGESDEESITIIKNERSRTNGLTPKNQGCTGRFFVSGGSFFTQGVFSLLVD